MRSDRGRGKQNRVTANTRQQGRVMDRLSGQREGEDQKVVRGQRSDS